MHFNYHIYGLNISSSREITLLKAISGVITDMDIIWTSDAAITPDTDLSWQGIVTPELRNKEKTKFFSAATAEGTYYKLSIMPDNGSISFILSPAKNKLWVLHNADESDGNLDSFFVGIGMGFVLRLRGVLCLHASGVEINGQAVLFLGRKKSGKSTTAATFSKMGYRVVTDDVAAISIVNGQYYLEPGYPKIRLRRKPLAVIHPHHNDPDHFELVYSHRDTRYSVVSNNFSAEAIPLGAIYLLGESEADDATPAIEPVGAERLIRLHENTFAGFVITGDLRRHEFEQLSKLALNVPIRRIKFGRIVDKAHLQCEAVIKDFDQ